MWKWSFDNIAKMFLGERLKFFCQVSQSHKKWCKLPKRVKQMEVWTSRRKFRHNGGEKNWQKAILFLPHVPNCWKTGFFQKILFLKKTFLLVQRMQFDNTVNFFAETPIGFVPSLTLIKEDEREKIFFEKRWFSRTCFRSRRLQFWQIKRKVFDKKANCSRSMC